MACRYLHMIHVLLAVASWASNVQGGLRKPLNGTLASSRLRSGAVFLIDARTILVTQFSYDNGKTKNALKIHNKWFKGVIRRGDNVTSYVDLEFGNKTDARLTANLYLGMNVYVRVPDDSPFDVRHLSAVAIVNDKNVTKTAVPIDPEDLIDLPNRDPHYLYKDGRFVFVYPKCCPLNSYYKDFSCVSGLDEKQRASVPPERIAVHEVKDSMYNNRPMPLKRLAYRPYYAPPKCEHLVNLHNEDNITLLANLELFIPEVPRPRLSCMEFSENDGMPVREEVLVCLSDMNIDPKSFKSASSGRTNSWMQTVLLVIVIRIFM